MRNRGGGDGYERKKVEMVWHVKRRSDDNPLRKAMDFEVDGRRPPGRPRKTWKKTLEEDMRLAGVREEDALDRGRWRAMTKRQTPVQANRIQ